MPRRVRVRATRPRSSSDLDLSSLHGELPEWLVVFLLHRDRPRGGTAEDRMLEQLMATTGLAPGGLVCLSPLRTLWIKHRAALMARWESEGHPGVPWGTTYGRDPNDDPRALGTAEDRCLDV